MQKLLLSVFLVSILASASAFAQAFSIPPSPGAVFLGSFPLRVHIEPDPNGGIREAKVSGTTNADLIAIGGVFRTTGGKIEYMVASDSIRFTGGDSLINATPTSAFYELLGHAIVERGTVMGFSPCLSREQCGDNSLALKAYSEACVQRVGYGSMTRFLPCDRYTFSYRSYTNCCGNTPSEPNVTRVNYSAGTYSCSGSGCDATCPPVGGDGGQLR